MAWCSMLCFVSGSQVFQFCTNKTITDTHGTIISPNHPRNYPNDVDCAMELRSPRGTTGHLTVHVHSFELEFLFDILSIKIDNLDELRYNTMRTTRVYACKHPANIHYFFKIHCSFNFLHLDAPCAVDYC